jgi:hypothetical protein
VQGWQWGSCSDNVSYGTYFARNFLDNRELDVDVRNDTAVRQTVVHLHNNAVGRKVSKCTSLGYNYHTIIIILGNFTLLHAVL